MSPHPENLATPLGRVQAFAYHHRRTAHTNVVEAVLREDDRRGAIALTRSDLEYVLETLERIKALAFRAAPDSPFLPDTLTTIFHLAAGIAPGVAAPVGPDHPMALTIKPDGGVYQDPSQGGDPYAAGGGGLRTRTCVHCGRRCGDVPGGSGIVNAAPVCCPPEGADRPNCYQNLLRATCTEVHVCRRGCWHDGR